MSLPTDSSSLAVAAGLENIRFIGTPTTLTGTISGVGVVFIGSPVVGIPGDPSPISDGCGESSNCFSPVLYSALHSTSRESERSSASLPRSRCSAGGGAFIGSADAGQDIAISQFSKSVDRLVLPA